MKRTNAKICFFFKFALIYFPDTLLTSFFFSSMDLVVMVKTYKSQSRRLYNFSCLVVEEEQISVQYTTMLIDILICLVVISLLFVC